MDRLINEKGEVAVIVSPGYGAGWSTWNNDYPDLCFDPEIAACVMAGMKAEANELAEKKYPEVYCGGLSQAVLVWVDKGTQFEIDEYDGAESLRELGCIDFKVA